MPIGIFSGSGTAHMVCQLPYLAVNRLKGAVIIGTKMHY